MTNGVVPLVTNIFLPVPDTHCLLYHLQILQKHNNNETMHTNYIPYFSF